MASQIDICNKALLELGETVALTAVPGTTTPGIYCDRFWTLVLDEVLAAHKWDFAKKWVQPTLDSDSSVSSIISAASQANPCVLTVADGSLFATGHQTSQLITVTGVLGMTELNGIMYIATPAGNNLSLTDLAGTNINSSAFTVYTSGGTVVGGFIDSEYQYAYDLPSDYIRMSRMEDNLEQYEVRGDYLLSNNDELVMEYIFQETTTTNFPNHFILALVGRLKAALAVPLLKSGATGNKSAENLMKIYEEKILPYAMARDGQQGNASDKNKHRHTDTTETWLIIR